MKKTALSAINLTIQALALVMLASIILTSSPAGAATLSASPDSPAVIGDDIANYGEVTGTDKWFVENSTAGAAKGQTFRTGTGAVLLRAITYQVGDTQKAAPTKTYVIRVGTVSGSTFTQIYSETATQTFTWNGGEYMTWTFASPPLLNGNTTYAVDVGMTASTSSWQTGIPYLNVTASEYTAGQSYYSGTSGVGTTVMSLSVNSDRIFHLHLEPPAGPVLGFAAGNPPDNATNALVRAELVATFNQNLTLGTGNITIRNLTDSIDTDVPVNDPRISLSANLLKIATPSLVDWNKNYAIRIAPGAVKGNGGADFVGITNDTTWNFTTGAGDPLLVAIAAIKGHITGVTPLTAAQITTYSQTIALAADQFADSSENITAVFDLISTYDSVKGPLWVTVATSSLTRSAETNDLTWTIYHAMQNVMDKVYNPTTLASHESLFNGFKFGSSSNFPGACATPPLGQTHTMPVNGSFPHTFGRDTQGWTSPARRPTGCYLAPGTIATVTVPASLVANGYKIRVGAHSWDFSNKPTVKRLDRSSLLYSINAVATKVASPLGGGIYIEVPPGANAGVVDVTIIGAARSPFFQATSFHQTTLTEWLATERTQPGPWADFQTDKFMMQVPRSWIYALADPVTLMANWDLAMDAMNDLMGFPHVRGKETLYPQVDLFLRASVYAPGYPAVSNTYSPTTTYNGNSTSYLVKGPQFAPDYEFHEQGHAYGFPKFGGETESAVNLLHVAVQNRKFGATLDTAFRTSRSGYATYCTLDTTAMAWMTVFNFSPRKVPMADAEKAYQLKGHAKFVDIARLYGWDGLGAFWKYYNSNDENNISSATDTDSMLLRLCKSVGKDIRPLFHFWGIYPVNPASLRAAVAAEGLQPPVEIYDRLLYYKSLIPTNNATFRTFAQSYRGKVPSISGNWEEREHARQWDTTALYGVGDQQRSEATNPGEIYNENSANDIGNRVQELLDLYYPNGRPVNDYETWAGKWPAADLSDPNGDLDGDGMTNDQERIFGLDPTNGASANPIIVPLAATAGTFSYIRRNPSLTGRTFKVWTSINLQTWVEDTTAIQNPSTPDVNGVQSVAVTLSPGQLTAPSLFVRVQAVE